MAGSIEFRISHIERIRRIFPEKIEKQTNHKSIHQTKPAKVADAPGPEEVNEALGLLLQRHDMVYDVVARVAGRIPKRHERHKPSLTKGPSKVLPDLGHQRVGMERGTADLGSTPWLHLRSRWRSFSMGPRSCSMI